MQRRDFMRRGTIAAGATLLGVNRFPYHLYAADKKKQAQAVSYTHLTLPTNREV